MGVNAYDGKINSLDYYTEKYKSILSQYSDIIVGELEGHYH